VAVPATVVTAVSVFKAKHDCQSYGLLTARVGAKVPILDGGPLTSFLVNFVVSVFVFFEIHAVAGHGSILLV